VRPLVEGRAGLEVGGPSSIFARSGLLPLYPLVRAVDQCNFAARTMWDDLPKWELRGPPGEQLVSEAGDMEELASGSYDFVLSSHMLEHTANPLRALAEWHRVLGPGGLLILVVPHRDGTFDHRRPVTTLDHLRDDYARNTSEEDPTHFEEILALHDVSRDPGLGDAEELGERVRLNLQMRSLHHHVFDTRLAVDVVREVGFTPLAVEPLRPYHILVGAAKPPLGSQASLTESDLSRVLAASPFPTDRGARRITDKAATD
jgi:SAM-dependent methyltransferase